eukprot:715192-Hanusia_phi.AAC.1
MAAAAAHIGPGADAAGPISPSESGAKVETAGLRSRRCSARPGRAGAAAPGQDSQFESEPVAPGCGRHLPGPLLSVPPNYLPLI